MKKLLVLLMVLAFVAPAMADDTLDLSGAVRVRAFNKANYDFDTDSDNDNLHYFDQRFRVQGEITPADGVKGVFRVDMAENTWGVAGIDDPSSNQDVGGVDVDRAYLDVTKGMLNIKAGLQYLGLGNNVAYDAVHTGLVFTVKTPVTITAGYIRVDEDPTDAGDQTDEDGFEDINQVLLNLGYATDAMSINVFYAAQQDQADGTGADPKVEPSVIGVQGKFAIGPANVNAELNMFGGSADDGTTEIDFVGTQFFADVSMAMSDMLTLGSHLVYSTGEDEANETKITYLTDDGGTVFADYGAMNTLISSLGDTDIFDDGNGTGSMGLGLYAQFQAMEALTLYGQVMYLTAQQELDNTTGELENATIVNLSAKYTIVPNAHLSVQYHHVTVSLYDDVDSDAATGLGARLQIDF